MSGVLLHQVRLRNGRPRDSVLSQESLELHVLIGQALVSAAKGVVMDRLGRILLVPAFPRENGLEYVNPVPNIRED